LNFEDLVLAIAELDYQKVMILVNKYLEENVSARDILVKGLSPGLLIVGKRFETGEYFLSELLFASEIMKDAAILLEPKMAEITGDTPQVGDALIGTVAGDLHDIGKNIFKMLMRASGFKVIDLGVDISIEAFVEAVSKYKPDILGMSALLTTTAPEFRKVISALKKSDLREHLFILIGGPPHLSAEEAGADKYYNDAFKGVKAALDYMEKKTSKE
jgi:5-methyltetrahydrofolate--homocysteine methyltransferase